MIPLQEISAHNAQFLRQRGRLRILAADSATVVVATKRGMFQLLQIGFAKDGSFRAAWPYRAVGEGMLADVTFPDVNSGPMTFTLSDRGRFTSQLVKFSHHPAGLALFSQTGRIRSEVRRQSFPLTGPVGRLFHTTIVHPDQFKPLQRLKGNRAYLVFAVDLDEVPSYQVDALWHRKADVMRNAEGKGEIGPVTSYYNRELGDRGPALLYGAPVESILEPHLIVLKGLPVQAPEGPREPSVIFLGGYDRHEVEPGQSRAAAKSRGGLAAMYPVYGSPEMKARLGSVDLAIDELAADGG